MENHRPRDGPDPIRILAWAIIVVLAVCLGFLIGGTIQSVVRL
jgi:hypothetical protein